MAICGLHAVLLVTDDFVGYTPVRCKRWGCPECEGMKLAQLRELILAGRPNMMLTLDAKPRPGYSPAEDARRMLKAWEHFRKRIERRWGIERLQYVLVVEEHKSGRPHIHVLLRVPYIPHKWLLLIWRYLIGKGGAHVRYINNARVAARYVTKYITKAPIKYEGLHRYHRSKNWRVEQNTEPKIDWRGAKKRLLKDWIHVPVLTLLQQTGHTEIRVGPSGIFARRPHSGVPPPLWDCTVELADLPRAPRRVDRLSEVAERAASGDALL